MTISVSTNIFINGIPCDTISVNDRGLLYGDGVFRTMLLRNGKVQRWLRQFAKLQEDCDRINLSCPPESLLHSELASMISSARDGVMKIIITRGNSHRGYAPAPQSNPTRIVSLNPLPQYPAEFAISGVRMHICKLRLAHQPYLAGVKHLNRLENVLAASEWSSPEIAEGLLLDESGFVIEGVRSNLFMVKNGTLITPCLSRCGVSGVQRERIIELANLAGMPCSVSDVALDDLLDADEIFLVNSVIGLWPVRQMQGYYCDHHPVSQFFQNRIAHEVD